MIEPIDFPISVLVFVNGKVSVQTPAFDLSKYDTRKGCMHNVQDSSKKSPVITHRANSKLTTSAFDVNNRQLRGSPYSKYLLPLLR
jgi:hypothetical protein